MGQGASTPQNDGRETQNHGTSGSSQQQDEATRDQGSQAQDGQENRNSIISGLRRSRRLRSRIDISRIGRGFMSSSPTPPATTSPTAGSRVRDVRFRASRYARRSPSPSSLNGSSPNRTSSSLRQRYRNPPIARPPPLSESEFADTGADMMDISPVTTITPHSTTPPTPTSDVPPAAAETRRSRMARVRSSISSGISSWPSMLPEMGSSRSSRPGSGRPSHSRRNSLFMSDRGNSTDMDTDMSHASEMTPNRSSDSSPSRSGGIASGSGSLNDDFDNPARVRPGEDQAAMLSRLLSVAAAATAASLVGNTEQAITEAQDVAGDNGGDGSFESFLRALQNGRLAAALRNGGNELGGGTPPDAANPSETLMAPLNFFRMFRFGSTSNEGNNGGDSAEGARARMVPVIIVGIRSVTPRDTTDGEGNRPAPFFDALANLPVNLPGVHRRSRLSNSHRRASMGGTPVGFDNQRHSRAASTNSLRPMSDINPTQPPIPTVLSDTPPGPHPPPSTPAEPSLPTFPTSFTPEVQNTTDRQEGPEEHATSSARDAQSRRRLSRRLSSPEALLPSSSRTTGATNNNNSSSSSSSGGAGSGSGSRRPQGNTEGTRSWIIYVLGGSYPEDHPILTTPSLFTDAPTYEDMMLLSSLLGPAKPPVASRDDVDSAGGTFTLRNDSSNLVDGDRCLICLGDYEKDEECRILSKCQHVFHKDCIDEWLTTGRNSCPLCRSQGVNEKEPPAASTDNASNPVEGTAS